ncbi:phospholipase C [Herbiconiux sp. P17]|uniref:phospholipase C n=1 Tax=Herbiconiux wuyangfengii TaxID=3342794 RepID=UPI0035B95690
MPRPPRRRGAVAAAAVLALAGVACLGTTAAGAFAAEPTTSAGADASTTTPIKHVVVIYDENESFDHYFGTYPNAANTDGTPFTAAADTPIPNNYVSHPELLTANPNAFQPQRLDQNHALTCDQSHSYGAEQKAYNAGAMDKFVESTESSCSTLGLYYTDGIVMDYYDGNTVTGLWNLAQNYAMSDNSFSTGFGPSTPGALNLVSGNTSGARSVNSVTGAPASDATSTVTSDPDPFYDDCADTNHTKTGNLTQMQGKNIGDLLNDKGVSWGWFEDGFAPSVTAADSPTGYAVCGNTVPITAEGVNVPIPAYSPHHEPFEYYESTSNPHHLPPASAAEVGHDGQANHNYDMSEFYKALDNDALPAVTFLKAATAQDGHPGSSNPTDEQISIVKEVNAIEQSSAWPSTAIVFAYDDSDGWYDHVASPILNGSAADGNSAICTDAATVDLDGLANRCGPGPRQPLLVISPFAKQNYIDHTATEQTSILKFIEDNWSTGRIGDSSFDERAGVLDNMFDFQHPQQRAVVLAGDGSVAQVLPVDVPGAGDGSSTPPATDPAGDGSTPTPAATASAAGTGSGDGKSLAATGLQVGLPLTGAALLLAAGVTLWLVRRRRSA